MILVRKMIMEFHAYLGEPSCVHGALDILDILDILATTENCYNMGGLA